MSAFPPDEDSRGSLLQHPGQSHTVSTKKKNVTQKAVDKGKLKIKMLVDVAKLDTEMKDSLEKEFLDASDNADLFSDKYGYCSIRCSLRALFRWSFMPTNE